MESTLSFDFNPMNAANLRLPWLNGRDGMSVVKSHKSQKVIDDKAR